MPHLASFWLGFTIFHTVGLGFRFLCPTFLTFSSQVLASHPADPTGVVIDYALYGKDRLQLYGDAHTPSNGNVGSDNQCMLKNSYKMRIYGELNCGSLRYYGSKWDKATKQIFYEDVNVKGNTYGGYANYEKNMTHGGSLSGAANSGYVIKGIKSNSIPTFLTPITSQVFATISQKLSSLQLLLSFK